jgi:type IV secretion system protein VirB5
MSRNNLSPASAATASPVSPNGGQRLSTVAGERPLATDKSPLSSVENGRTNALVQNARREFSSAFSDLARGKRNWQLIAFCLGAVSLLQGLTVFRLAASAHPVPFVVQTDRLGGVSAVGLAEQLREPDNRLVASQLATFMRNARTVLPSAASTAQADLLRRAYAFTAPGAASFLNSYFGDPLHDPRALGARIARDVRVSSVLRVPDPPSTRPQPSSPQTWRLQWIETDRAIGPLEQSEPARVATWEGYVTLQIASPRSVDGIQDNPLGIRITSIAWTRLAEASVPRDSLNSLMNQSQDGGTQ